MIAILVGCHGADPDDSGDSDVPPSIVADASVEQPSPYVPYSRLLHVELDVAAPLRVIASDGVTERIYDLPAAERHEVPLPALYADRTWTLTMSSDGTALGELEFTTDPLPEPFPTIDVLASDPDRMQPGLTVFPLVGGQTANYLVGIDAAGAVAWLYDEPELGISEVSERDGALLTLRSDGSIVTMDWLGRTIERWSSNSSEPHVAIEPGHMHHEVLQTTSGSFVTFTADSLHVPAYPTAYEAPPTYEAASVRSDTMWEVDATTGATLGSWRIGDILDTARLGYAGLDETNDGWDWSHSNAIARDEERDLWLVSVRNQDVVVAFDDAGEIAWMLGCPDQWRAPWADRLLMPVDDVRWPFHAHGLKWDDGRALMFDNQVYQAIPFSGVPQVSYEQSSSRVVEYEVDPDAMTVRESWSWELDPPAFSRATGDADRLANGDVLAVWGDVLFTDRQLNRELGRGVATVRVVEFDPVTGDERFDLDIWAASDAPEPAWRSYRAVRIADPR